MKNSCTGEKASGSSAVLPEGTFRIGENTVIKNP